MKKVLTGCLAVVVLAGCASDPIAVMPDGSEVHGRSFTPTAKDVAVVLECTLAPRGALDACVVVQETHPGQGFAEAALQSIGKARLEPRQGGVGDKIRFTMRFREE